jgi:predicted ester cyclase
MHPTDERVCCSGIIVYRIVDDKIVEQWTEIDLFGFLQQLGALLQT